MVTSANIFGSKFIVLFHIIQRPTTPEVKEYDMLCMIAFLYLLIIKLFKLTFYLLFDHMLIFHIHLFVKYFIYV